MRFIRSTNAALRLLDPEQQFLHEAYIHVVAGCKPVLVTRWKNTEVYGIWELSYGIHPDVTSRLAQERIIELEEGSTIADMKFRLRKK